MLTSAIKALVVDDETHAQELLVSYLKSSSHHVNVLDVCSCSVQARKSMDRISPNVVFLDIKMPGESGLEFLKNYDFGTSYPIFTTSYSEFAIEALKEGAFDYLLKPIDSIELEETLARLSKNLKSLNSMESTPDKLRLEIRDNLTSRFISLSDIKFLDADGSYTSILTTKDSYLISKNLKSFETVLSTYQMFFRIHHKTILNLKWVDYFDHSENIVYLKTGDYKVVSSRRKDAFLKKMRTI